MRPTKRLRVLRELYASIPSVECKGLCVDSCSYIPVAPAEQLALADATGRPVELVHESPVPDLHSTLPAPFLRTTSDGRCPHLVLGRCSVHEVRPLVCRLFGVAEGMRCRHGCEPERIVSDAETGRLIKRTLNL